MIILRQVAATAAITIILTVPAQSQVGRRESMLDPNLATELELAALPHITPALAQAMVDRRPFLAMGALDAFLGETLNREQRTQLYERMFLHLNLNTATREEILLIPRMGNRMLGEFLEYRPYRALAQFRREIGKYVDETELARLEGYVFVPIDLNTATDEAILSIPGVGRRMLHEFKEYRPYRTIEQFRREIGKYVDAGEVARLERYVTLGN